MQVLLFFINNTLGFAISATQTFCCEKSKLKRDFLMAQFKPVRLFMEVADLGRRMAADVVSGTEVFIPWCFLFMAGFRCKCRSQAPGPSSWYT